MVADIESRVNDCENTLKDHERRITSSEQDIKEIRTSQSEEKSAIAVLDAKITQAIANHEDAMKTLKWIVIAALTVIAALAGIKIALPGV